MIVALKADLSEKKWKDIGSFVGIDLVKTYFDGIFSFSLNW